MDNLLVSLIVLFVLGMSISIIYIVIKNHKTQKKIDDLKRRLVSDTPILYSPTKSIENLISANFTIREWRPEFYDNCKVYAFDEITGFEYIEDGEVILTTTTRTKGGITRALVGGMLAGGAGALVGAATARQYSETTEEKVITRRSIRISVSNPNVNQIEINIPKRKRYCITTATETYFVSIDKVTKEIISLLESIVNTSNRDACAPVNTNASNPEDPVAQIRRYKQLLDEGIITQEDFDTKKKQLLGI